MPGRGPQTFKKRQKEQQRKEKQQEKMAKRLARKDEGARPAAGDQETGAPFTGQDAQTEAPETNSNHSEDAHSPVLTGHAPFYSGKQ